MRSWKLFLALLLGIVLASTFFCGINVGADTVAKQMLDRQLDQVSVDLQVSFGSPISANDLISLVNEIDNSNIEGITHIEVISRVSEKAQLPDSNETYSEQAYFRIIGITENSYVYDGLMVANGSSSLGVNETYVWVGSESYEDLGLGDVLQFNLTVGWFYEGMGPPKLKTLTLNLTVVGFVDLEDRALKIVTGGYYYWITSTNIQIGDNILIVDWNETLAGLIDAYYDEEGRGLDNNILIFLDRESVINPWDIDGSMQRISTITSQVRNIVNLATHEAYVSNRLEYILRNYGMMSQGMRLAFMITSLPVFFIAWYMGTTVSDVSYNLRRREIGLLLTKGFSRRQLLRMFLGEAVLIGLIGGIIGVGLSFLVTPFFIQSGGIFTVMPVIGMDTIIITFIFSTGLTLLSVFRPARRASKLDIVDALKEYQYIEEVKPYKKKWPWIAFILGTYKIVMWLLGINLFTLLWRMPSGNIFIIIVLGVWMYFDLFVLNYIGPILFFWGFTKIFIRGSLKFQEFMAKLVTIAGDLSALSTKNVRRNPARTAAIAFLIAMIIGYSLQIIGSQASEQDYIIRQVRFNVGADISVQLSTLQNLSLTMDKIRNMSDVSSITAECRFYGQSPDGGSMTLIAVNPEEWLNVAYYENSLFTGRDVVSAFQEMQNDNNTIIIERRIADTLNLTVGKRIAVKISTSLGPKTCNLKVVGFFGPQQPPIFGYSYYYWSYVPEGLYRSLENEVNANGKLLVKLVSGADGKAVAEEIRNLKLSDISSVYSVTEILEQIRENPFGAYPSPFVSFGFTGSTQIQRLGVAFAVLAASLGTALVTLVSLRERSKEVGIMSVRGLSFRQIVNVLLTDNLAIVGFAVLLGAIIGLIVVQGNISAANSMPMPTLMPGPTPIPSYSPILRRMVFPLDSILTLTVCCVLVFASTVIPIILTTRRYISKVERIMREV